MAEAKNRQELKNERKAQKAERRAAEAKKAKKSKTQNIILVTAVAVVLAFFILLVGAQQVVQSGIIERHTTVMSTENFSVTKSMMTYFFNNNYQNYAAYGSSLGLDTSKDLKAQTYGNSTWYDMIVNQAQSQANEYLVLREAALAEGWVLPDEAQEEVDEVVESLKTQAKEYGWSDVNSFIKAVYGTAVNMNDVKKCLELAVYAEHYAEKLSNEGQYTTEDYAKYFEENKDSYTYVDYLMFAFSATKGSDGKYAEADVAEMKKHSEALAATTTVEEFKAYVRSYLTEEAKAALKDGEELDEAAIEEDVEATLVDHTTKSSLPSVIKEDFLKDSILVGTTATLNEEKNGSFTVYMKATNKYKDEYVVREAMTMFIYNTNHTDETGAKAFADEILAKWNASAKDEEAFEALAHEYDESGSHAHGAQMMKKSDSVYTEWLYDEARAAGDIDKVVSTTDKGVYIVYYKGESDKTAWEYDVDNAMRSRDYSNAYSEFRTIHWVYTNDEINSITPVKMSTES